MVFNLLIIAPAQLPARFRTVKNSTEREKEMNSRGN